MRIRIEYYVFLVVIMAVGCAAFVSRMQPPIPDGGLGAIALLVALALVGEGLSYLLPISSSGSVAFIPYFACVLVAPNWQALAAIAIARVIADGFAKRQKIKVLFNAAAHALSLGLAVVAYGGLGGTSLLELSDRTLMGATVATGGPALAAFTVAYVFSVLLVSGAIAISSGLTTNRVLESNHKSALWIDLLSVPLVFVFAWVYARFGPIAAATLWVPILGLRQVHKINLELERTNEELLELMVKSMEARDPYTSGHSRRVQHYSTVIARAVGLEERDIRLAGRAALLHDVGKIHEKYGPILLKSDRLSPEEWAVIQSHPAEGASLVGTISRLKDVVEPIRHHHENWDGTGYPDGLAGELIPLASRVIRFADTIDAMTTDRPYRRSMTEQQVRAELVRCRGQQFDPVLTDKLLSSQLWSQLFAQGASEAAHRPVLSVLHGRASSA